MQDLTHLADLIARRNAIDAEIANLIGRPVHSGHVGEFLAARIFPIDLHERATTRASDGVFKGGPLSGSTVNIKFYSKWGGLLDMVSSEDPTAHPDYYLIMSGPVAPPISSKGTHSPLVIESVYLFHSNTLLEALKSFPRMVKLGIGTSIRKQIWQQAMIYPEQVNQALILTDEQRAALQLFAPRD